jgi:hypothetical protein
LLSFGCGDGHFGKPSRLLSFGYCRLKGTMNDDESELQLLVETTLVDDMVEMIHDDMVEMIHPGH